MYRSGSISTVTPQTVCCNRLLKSAVMCRNFLLSDCWMEGKCTTLYKRTKKRREGKKKKTLKDTRKIQNLQWVLIWWEANIKLITNRDTHTPFVPVCTCYLMSNVQLVIQAVWGDKPEVNLWIKWGDITFLSGWTQLLSWLVFLDHWASGSSPHTSSLPSWESGTAKMATAGDALHFGCTDTCDWCHDGSVSYFYSLRYKSIFQYFADVSDSFISSDVMWCEWCVSDGDSRERRLCQILWMNVCNDSRGH